MKIAKVVVNLSLDRDPKEQWAVAHPEFFPVNPNTADSSATTMSHTAARPEPPPSAAPWMRPITIAGTVLMARNMLAPAVASARFSVCV